MTDVAWVEQVGGGRGGHSCVVLEQPCSPFCATAVTPAQIIDLRGRGEFFVRTTPQRSDELPVLLIHGWLATADLTFHGVYDRLAAQRAVVAADQRGHGRSVYPEAAFTVEDAADDNAALLRHLGYDHAIVVGFSLGAVIAQMMVARHRDLVAGLVLAGGELAPRRRPHEKAYLRAAGVVAAAQRLTSGRWASHRLVSKAQAQAGRTPDRDWLVAEMERGHPGALRAAGRAMGRFDGRPIAAAHRDVPTALVLTGRDRVVRPQRQQALADAWGAHVVEIDGDHDVPIARPGAFADAVAESLELVAARTRRLEAVPAT